MEESEEGEFSDEESESSEEEEDVYPGAMTEESPQPRVHDKKEEKKIEVKSKNSITSSKKAEPIKKESLNKFKEPKDVS